MTLLMTIRRELHLAINQYVSIGTSTTTTTSNIEGGNIYK